MLFNAQLWMSTAILVGNVNARALRPRDCSFTWPAYAGDDCRSMASSWSISEAEFISFNPGVDCSNLVVGTEYCVEWAGPKPSLPPPPPPASTTTSAVPSTTTRPGGPEPPSPTQDGLVENCKFVIALKHLRVGLNYSSGKKFHLAVSGDTCSKIVSTYGTFSLSQLYVAMHLFLCAKNESILLFAQLTSSLATTGILLLATVSKYQCSFGLKQYLICSVDCSGLWAGYYYCIAVEGTPTAPPETSPTPSTPSGPSPVQDGIASDCMCSKIPSKTFN